ncbi:MAG: BamA/TamA family outer membrane protein [Myxococcota bacterium]
MHASVRLSLLFFVALALVAGACRGARKRVDGDLVQSVKIKGLGWPFPQVTEAQIQAQMGQKESGFGVRTPLLNTFSRTAALDDNALQDDTYRIETWLAHQGFFDARVDGWQVRRLRPVRYRRDGLQRKAGVVRIVGHLTLGPRSTVRSFDVVWADPAGTKLTLEERLWRSGQEGAVKRTGYVEPGTPFVLGNVDYTLDKLQRQIRDHGYVFGEVAAAITAVPGEGQVDVVFNADPGPESNLAAAPSITGNERVATADVLDVIDLKPGDRLKVSELEKAQQRLVSLGVFSVAQVEPQEPAPGSNQVPVHVSVTEGRFGQARAGGGVRYDGTTITPRLSTEIEHLNIDGRLAKLEASANVGAGIPLVGGFRAARLLGGFDVGITRPRVFGKKWDTTARASLQRDLLSGQLLYTRARLNAGLTHRFSDDVVLNFGPAAEFVRLGAGSLLGSGDLSENDELLVAATFGGDPSGGRNPFFMALLESQLTVDWRKGEDPVLDPRGGFYYQFGFRQALPFAENSPRFTDLYAEAKLYRSWLSRDRRSVPWTVAWRSRGRWMPGTRDLREAIPYSERAFMGGSQDMRSFRINQVGAYDCVCLVRDQATGSRGFLGLAQPTGPERLEPNPTFLPRGGRLALLSTLESRYRTRAGWGLAAFVDAGLLTSQLIELQPKYWKNTIRYGGGLGYRQGTPIGPIRVDLAVRPVFPEDQAPMRADAFTVAGEPADPTWYQGQYYGCDAIPDARLTRRIPALGVSRDLKGGLPPVMFNLSVAIGEAI